MGVVGIALGDMHSILLKQDGSVWCSGFNVDGQLGIGSKFSTGTFVQAIPRGAKAAAAGTSHSIVLMEDGSVWTTGQNSYGQLGDALSSGIRRFFVQVISGEAKAVAAGSYHSMVMTQTGGVWVAGWNKYGQLGDASTTEDIFRIKFVQVMPSGAKAMAAGEFHSIVVKQDGSVWATGRNNNGQLGDRSRTDRNAFVQVMLSGAEAAAAGGFHSLVLKQDGTVWATGWNRYGQLGDETVTDKNTYVQVFFRFTGAKAVAAGSRHSMVLKTDGSVWVTGKNYHGQLGDGSKSDKRSFVQVLVSGAKAVGAGSWHSMVLKQDGSVWTTGSNQYGQLGHRSPNNHVFVQIGNNGEVHDGVAGLT